MKHLYQAEDGKIFEDAKKCEEYEHECAKACNHVIGLDMKGNIFTYGECETNGIPFFIEAQYFWIKDDEAKEYLKTIDLMMEDFKVNTIYYYDQQKDKFVWLVDKILELDNAKEALEYYIKTHFDRKGD